MSTDYLRNFVEGVADVPGKLQRTFRSIRELDERVAALNETLRADRAAQLRRLTGEGASTPRGERGGIASTAGSTPGAVAGHKRLRAEIGASRVSARPADVASNRASGRPGEAGADRGALARPGEGNAGASEPSDAELARRVVATSAEILRLSSEKTDTAQQAYDLVDGIIRGLDGDLEAFDADLAALAGVEGDGAAATAPAPLGAPDAKGAGSGRAARDRRRRGGAADALAQAPAQAAPPASDEEAYQTALATSEPGDPTYCICNRINFGEMIACDNPDCAIEWFHLGCVGLTPETKPEGTWYCPDCTRLLGKA